MLGGVMRQSGLLSTILLCIVAVQAPSSAAGDVPLVVRYDLGASLLEPDRASVVLRLRLINPTPKALMNLELAVVDSLYSGDPLATFRALTVPPGGQVDLERTVTLPLREHELWRAGGRPKLRLITTDEEGFTRAQRVELLRERMDPVPAEHGVPPGPVNIQAQPGGGGQP